MSRTNTRRLISVQEAAQYTGLAVSTLYTMANQGRIHSVKLGRRLLFDVALLEQWIQQNTVMPMPEKQC